MSFADVHSIAPELIVTLGAFVVLFVRKHSPQIAVIGLLLALLSLFFLPQGEFFFGAWEIHAFAIFFKALFLVVALLVVLGSPGTLGAEREKEYYALVLFATVGMLGVAGAKELITLFVSFELSSLSTYALAGYIKRDERSLEAATKFFIIGALSSALSIYGISLIYGATNTTFIQNLVALQSPDLEIALRAGLVFVLAGFGFKITVVPFHFWAPDVYEGAPAPVTALLAAGSKKMGFLALIKIFLMSLVALELEWGLLFGVLALLTMTVGNLLALVQSSVKRMLAYSSIAHAGYILIAFAVGTEYGLVGGLFHIVTHAVTTAGLFLIVALLAAKGLGEEYASYSGLNRRQPLVALVLLLSLLSLAGVPPLPGFQSKFVLFGSAVDAGLANKSWLVLLAIAGVVNSALSLAFYARLIKVAYVDEPKRALANPHPEALQIPPLLLVVLLLELLFIVVFAFQPNVLLEGLRLAVQAAF
ncbi:MAG: NADH-quinone oxidoreductase subunit N [Candidatus Bipolaricaulota bacterium]|nr:NADH-quinone oxidoreductase subunit N [Candidatus Bipolaricaulota bacterium]